MQGGSGTFFGGGGNDVFKFELGGGQDHIVNGGAGNVGPSSELDFAVGIGADQLWFEQKGNDLSISVLGSHDQITIDNWYGASTSQLQEIKLSDGLEIDSGLPQLVQAMAAYAAANPSFDPAAAIGLPSDASLQAEISAAWHHV
jgi:serralysin